MLSEKSWRMYKTKYNENEKAIKIEKKAVE